MHKKYDPEAVNHTRERDNNCHRPRKCQFIEQQPYLPETLIVLWRKYQMRPYPGFFHDENLKQEDCVGSKEEKKDLDHNWALCFGPLLVGAIYESYKAPFPLG